MQQKRDIVNIVGGVVTLLLLLSMIGCSGDEWMATRITVSPKEQLRKGDKNSEVPIEQFVGMHMFFVKDTVGWSVESYADAVEGVITHTGSLTIEGDVATGEKKNADREADYYMTGALVFKDVDHPMVVLVGYDSRQAIYGWIGVEIVSNLSSLQIDFVIRGTSWNGDRTYTQNRWTVIDDTIVNIPEPDPEEPDPEEPDPEEPDPEEPDPESPDGE